MNQNQGQGVPIMALAPVCQGTLDISTYILFASKVLAALRKDRAQTPLTYEAWQASLNTRSRTVHRPQE